LQDCSGQQIDLQEVQHAVMLCQFTLDSQSSDGLRSISNRATLISRRNS
jgi:hypothetical protein